MSMHRRAARKDANHGAIVEALRRSGCSVYNWGADGAPDLVVGLRGKTILVEIKDGAKPACAQRLTPLQSAWMRTWRGSRVYVVTDVSQVPVVLSMETSEDRGMIR